MKCYAYGKEIENGMNQCSACGFTALYAALTGDAEKDRQTEKQCRDLGRQYRQNKIGGTQVGLVIYYYAMKDDKIRKSKESRKILADCGDLTVGEVKWLDQDFARVETDTLSLNVFVRSNDEDEFHDLEVNPPKTEDFWHIGIVLEEGLKVRLVIRAGEEEVRSEEFSLI